MHPTKPGLCIIFYLIVLNIILYWTNIPQIFSLNIQLIIHANPLWPKLGDGNDVYSKAVLYRMSLSRFLTGFADNQGM